MEITRDNFLSSLPKILNSIQSADFIAIDTEFTGFVTAMNDEGHSYDTLEDKYLKIKVACENFWPCQLGICPFKYSESQHKFVAEPYSIYLLPYEKYTPLTVQTSCMQFLAENKFDLGKLFTKGVSYCRESEFEEEYKKIVSDREISLLSDERQEQMNSIKNRIKDFISSTEKSLYIPIGSDYNKKIFFSNRGPAKHFSGINFTPKIIEDSLYIEAVKSKKGGRFFDRPPQNLDSDSRYKEEKRSEILGATQIINALIAYRKPLIGHNMIYDIGYIYHHLIKPLPATLLEFKQELRKTLSPFYDTKIISIKMFDPKTFYRFHLDGLYNTVTTNTKFSVHCDVALGLETTQKLSHDAGYDAYMTGCIFLYLTHTIMHEKRLSTYWDAVVPVENRIHIQLNHINFIDLDNDLQLEDEMYFENVVKVESNRNIDVRYVATLLARYGDVKVTLVSEYVAIAKFEYLLDEFIFQDVLKEIGAVQEFKVKSLSRVR